MDLVCIGKDAAGDVSRMIEMMPEVTLAQLAKAVSVSVLVVQQEAYNIIGEARDLDGARRMKRAYVASEMLGRAGALATAAASLKKASVKCGEAQVKVTNGVGGGLRLVQVG